MRILLAAPHRYPASGPIGSGLHPKQYPSGSGYHLHDLLARGLAEAGHQVFYYLGSGAESDPPPGVTLVSEPCTDVDICHAVIGPPGFAERVERQMQSRGVPALLTCHMREHGDARPNWVFVSRSLAASYGSDRFVLNGVDPGEFCFAEAKDGYFLFLGAMNKAIDKGLDIALSVAQRKRVRLIAAGTGLDYDTVRSVSTLCAESGAEYVGDVRGREKAELLAGARALLFPSRLSEGCPLVILEAMVSGTPVIASPAGGVPEIVTPQTGFLCDSDAQWLDAVDRVGAISPRHCREAALERYHYRRMTADYLREYERELGGPVQYAPRPLIIT